MLERCDWIAFAEMHEHGATWLLCGIRCNLRRVIAHDACNSVDLCGATPRHRAAPAIAERRDLAGRTDSLSRRTNVSKHLVPWNLAAQFAASNGVIFRIAEFGPTFHAIKQRWCDGVIALCRVAVANPANVRGDAENFLQEHEARARLIHGERLIGAELVSVLCPQ